LCASLRLTLFQLPVSFQIPHQNIIQLAALSADENAHLKVFARQHLQLIVHSFIALPLVDRRQIGSLNEFCDKLIDVWILWTIEANGECGDAAIEQVESDLRYVLKLVLRQGLKLTLLGASIGSVGAFFAQQIKAAVSRQRELLADASGVQFTRNPEGLAGALKKIGGLDQGSELMAPRAEEASHFFFAEGIGRWTQLMSTHPPLLERIRELDPQFRGELAPVGMEPVAVEQELPYAAMASTGGARAISARPRDVLATIGKLDDQHIAYAQSLLARLPQRVREAVREPWVARALVLALLLDRRSETRALQLKAVLSLGDAQLADQVARAAAILDTCPLETRLPILDLSLPALRRLSPAQSQQLRAAVDALAQADSRLSLFEYTLECVLRRHLGVQFGTAPRADSSSQVSFDQALSLVLSMLVHSGAADAGAAARAFSSACATLSTSRPRPKLLARQECSLGGLEVALSRLAATAPRLRKEILGACAAAVASDAKVTIAEGELLRAVSESLGCPMPPLLPGQQVGANEDGTGEGGSLRMPSAGAA